MRGLVLTLALLVALAAGVGRAGGERDVGSAQPEALARAVTPEGLKRHLVALAGVARRNGGSRDAGSRGYQQSVAYVVRQLRAVGYRPRLHSFSFDLFRETRPPRLERLAPDAKRFRPRQDFVTMRYSGGGGVTGQVVPVEAASASSGCDRAAFAGFPSGAVALVRRGTCFMALKARNAKAAGASAVLIANDGAPGRTAPILGTLIQPGIGIPVLGISAGLGSELARTDGVRVRINVAAVTRRAQSQNVIAEIPGRLRGAVLLGAHLDSVAIGPGMNDNASGSALVLEIARQARRLGVRPARGLRFAFWGAEELGLVGSTAYVRSLGVRTRQQLSAVLNFDMVASPNFGRFIYDGEAAPPGSTRIEDLFQEYFSAEGLQVEEIPFGGSSDHAPFAQAGVAVGGLFTGGDSPKPRDLTFRFGGAAGRAFDPCFHQPCDTLKNISVRVLGQMADAAAVVALRLAG